MEQIASASDWISSAINTALLGALFIAVHIDNARQINERHDETFEMMRDTLSILRTGRDVDRQKQETFIAEQTAILEACIARSQSALAQHVSIQTSHTDDTIQRVLTRPEARVTPMEETTSGKPSRTRARESGAV